MATVSKPGMASASAWDCAARGLHATEEIACSFSLISRPKKQMIDDCTSNSFGKHRPYFVLQRRCSEPEDFKIQKNVKPKSKYLSVNQTCIKQDKFLKTQNFDHVENRSHILNSVNENYKLRFRTKESTLVFMTILLIRNCITRFNIRKVLTLVNIYI